MPEDVERRRAEVTRLVHRATRAMRHGRWGRALKINEKATEMVDGLVDDDPDDPRHRTVQGGLLYNRALIWERWSDRRRSRPGERAAEFAWSAVEVYLALDPTDGDHTRVAATLAAAGPFARDAVAERIARTADARARYVRQAARYRGDEVATEVQLHGVEALNCYGELLAAGTRYDRVDLDRLGAQVLDGMARAGLLSGRP